MVIFMPKPLKFYFGLVPKSPTHTGLICVKTMEPNISSLCPFNVWKNNLERGYTQLLASFFFLSDGELMAGGAAAAGAGQSGGAHLHRLSHTRRRVRHLYSGSRVQGAAT
jgi:hypothetical protein